MNLPSFRASSLPRAIFGFALVLVALVGFVQVGAEPARAAFCPPTIADCTFSHLQVGGPPFWEPTCCIYDCPFGEQEPLFCFE